MTNVDHQKEIIKAELKQTDMGTINYLIHELAVARVAVARVNAIATESRQSVAIDDTEALQIELRKTMSIESKRKIKKWNVIRPLDGRKFVVKEDGILPENHEFICDRPHGEEEPDYSYICWGSCCRCCN